MNPDATLAKVDAAVDGVCAGPGCCWPLTQSASHWFCSPTCQQRWYRQFTTAPEQVRGSLGVDPDPARWRPDLVDTFDDTDLVLVDTVTVAGVHRRVFRHRDGRWFARVDDGHRWTGVWVDARPAPDGEVWQRLERDLGNRRRLDPNPATGQVAFTPGACLDLANVVAPQRVSGQVFVEPDQPFCLRSFGSGQGEQAVVAHTGIDLQHQLDTGHTTAWPLVADGERGVAMVAGLFHYWCHQCGASNWHPLTDGHARGPAEHHGDTVTRRYDLSLICCPRVCCVSCGVTYRIPGGDPVTVATWEGGRRGYARSSGRLEAAVTWDGSRNTYRLSLTAGQAVAVTVVDATATRGAITISDITGVWARLHRQLDTPTRPHHRPPPPENPPL